MANKQIKDETLQSSLADTDMFAKDDAAGDTWYTPFSVFKSTLKTYFDAIYAAIVAPGTSGNVLTSNGSAWVSAGSSASVSAWISVVDSWSYSSASAITVPTGAASVYAVGDKIKLTQTTVKYFYVIGVADTLLTVTGGSDYTVANAAISAIYYSHAENPVGFPGKFNTGSITVDVATMDNGFGAQPTTATSSFSIVGRLLTHTINIQGVKAATGRVINYTRPTTMPAPAYYAAVLCYGSAWACDPNILGIIQTSGSATAFIIEFTGNIGDDASMANGVAATYSYLI